MQQSGTAFTDRFVSCISEASADALKWIAKSGWAGRRGTPLEQIRQGAPLKNSGTKGILLRALSRTSL